MQWKLPKNETLVKIAIAIAFAALLYFVLFRRERHVPTWGPVAYEDEMYEHDYEDDMYEDDDNQVVYDDDAEDDLVDAEDDSVDAEDDQVFVAQEDDDELAYDEETDEYEDDYENELEPFELYDSTVGY